MLTEIPMSTTCTKSSNICFKHGKYSFLCIYLIDQNDGIFKTRFCVPGGASRRCGCRKDSHL